VKLAELLEAEARRSLRRAPDRCKYGRILDDLDDDDRAEVETHHDTLASSALSRVMGAVGKPVSGGVITKHVSGACCCNG
jgi:hypothetical protein